MNREYIKSYSPVLQRDMEVLIYGDRGARVIFFPTRKAHFYDYENWGVIEALKPKIEQGLLQVYCVDSIDYESFYNLTIPEIDRIQRHIAFEKYITDELLPFSKYKNQNPFVISTGCSLGAFHAVNVAFRNPDLFDKVLGMSGRYDLTQAMGPFADLFYGYTDGDVEANMPNKYLQKITDSKQLKALKKLDITLAVGEQDAFLEDNIFLHQQLKEKDIQNKLYIWGNESHNPVEWCEMVKLYL